MKTPSLPKNRFGPDPPKPGSGYFGFHMPRAVASFRAVGWPAIPYPVDFKVDPHTVWRANFNLVEGLGTATTAGKEWAGLAGYRLRGWTEEFFPSAGTR